MNKTLIHYNPAKLGKSLQDQENPELFREIFPYTQIGRVPFDDSFVMPRPPKDIFITDTTFRDGQQARPPYTVKQIEHIFKLLHKLGGYSGLIRQSEFFLYSDKDKRAVAACQELGYKFPQVTGWIRANANDLKLVKEMGLKETGMLTSVSDYHIFLKLGKSRVQAMNDYLSVVSKALDYGIIPRCHFEDITRADIYGFCIPFARELMRLAEDSGIKIKIRLCDTMGFGVPYPGSSLPRNVGKIVRTFTDEAGVPSECLEWHGHNDFHKVFVNTVTAWLYGCSGANGTLLGFGERTGNAPIEALVVEYISLTGDDDAGMTETIAEIAHYFQNELKYNIPNNYPFVGRDFNSTSAGIHVDGLLKNEEIYNIFDTTKILGRSVPITITDKSGKAGVAYWINNQMNLTGDMAVDKRHPSVGKIYKRIMKAYEGGRNTSYSHQEMQKLVTRFMPELFQSSFDALKELAHTISAKIISRLAAQVDVTSLEPEKSSSIMKTFLGDYPFVQYAYLIAVDGHPITWEVSHPEDIHKYRALGPNPDFSDRDWFQGPLSSGKLYITDFYKSYTSGKLCLTVSVPVVDESDDIKAILGADIRFEELVKIQDNLDENDSDQDMV